MMFEIDGCNSKNETTVQTALSGIPGVATSLRKTTKGAYIVWVQSNFTQGLAQSAVTNVLANLNVKVLPTTEIAAIVVGH